MDVWSVQFAYKKAASMTYFPEPTKTQHLQNTTNFLFQFWDLIFVFDKMAGQLPVVKFCSENLKSGTRNWVLTREKVREALEEYGCFVALYDNVSVELSSNMFDSLKELFDVPLDRKLQNVSEKPYHGYFGQNPLMPIHESMGIEDPTLLTKTQSFSNLMWPSKGNKLFW